MPFSRPTLAQISDRIRGDITLKMGSQSSTLRRAWTSIFARALAGAVHLVYGYMEWSYKQYFATTAEREALIEKGKVYGLSIKPAQFAEGFIHATGVNGIVIPIGTIFKTVDGLRYESSELVTIASGFANVKVVAIEPGAASNLPSGTAVSLESPISGVTNAAVVADATPGPIAGGGEEETTEEFRARYLRRTKNPPQGGAKIDYELWAKEVPGTSIGEVFVYGPGEILGDADHPLAPGQSYTPPFGTVRVYLRSNDPNNPTPSIGDKNDVQVYLDTKKPLTATVEVFGVIPKAVTFSITNFVLSPGYSLSDAQTQIEAELKDLFLREAFPNQTVTRSQIIEAISSTPAEKSHILALPASDVTMSFEEFGTVVTPITITI